MSVSRRSSAVATDPPAAKRVKRTPNNTEGKGSSLYNADDGTYRDILRLFHEC
jgi:hypothetical protein